MTTKNGTVFEGQFANNKKNGFGVMNHLDRKYEGNFKDNLPHGKGKVTYKDGHLVKGVWNEGVYVENSIN